MKDFLSANLLLLHEFVCRLTLQKLVRTYKCQFENLNQAVYLLLAVLPKDDAKVTWYGHTEYWYHISRHK